MKIYTFFLLLMMAVSLQAQEKNSVKVIDDTQEVAYLDQQKAEELTVEVYSKTSNVSENRLKEQALDELKTLAASKGYSQIGQVDYTVKKEDYGKRRKIIIQAQVKAYQNNG